MELLGEARDLVALVRRRKKAVTEAFDDIGEACVRLQDKAMVAVLGRRSFAEVCEQDLALGVATARRLIAIVTTMTRTQALAMGQQKALAMVTLEEATPERDTPAPSSARRASPCRAAARSAYDQCATDGACSGKPCACRIGDFDKANVCLTASGCTTNADCNTGPGPARSTGR